MQLVRNFRKKSDDHISELLTQLRDLVLEVRNQLPPDQSEIVFVVDNPEKIPDGTAETKGSLHETLFCGKLTTAELELQEAVEAYERRGTRGARVAEASLERGRLARHTQQWDLALASFARAGRSGDARQRAIAALGQAQVAVDLCQWRDTLAGQLASATAALVEVKEPTLADRSRWKWGVVLRALGRDAEARLQLEAARSGFHARGQAEAAERIAALLAER